MKLIQLKLKPDSEMPWWVAEKAPPAGAPVSTVHPQLAVLDGSETPAPIPLVHSFLSQQVDMPDQNDLSSRPALPLEGPPAQSWEFISNCLPFPTSSEPVAETGQSTQETNLAPQAELHAAEAEVPQENPAPRRSWLRRLLHLGEAKKVRRAENHTGEDERIAEPAPLPGKSNAGLASDPLLAEETIESSALQDSRDMASASHPLVIPSPDFYIQESFAETNPEDPTTGEAHRNPSESPEGVPTLPSRRGQYRK